MQVVTNTYVRSDVFETFETLYYHIHENKHCIYNMSKLHVNIFGQKQNT